jgi:hypothetical protein
MALHTHDLIVGISLTVATFALGVLLAFSAVTPHVLVVIGAASGLTIAVTSHFFDRAGGRRLLPRPGTLALAPFLSLVAVLGLWVFLTYYHPVDVHDRFLAYFLAFQFAFLPLFVISNVLLQRGGYTNSPPEPLSPFNRTLLTVMLLMLLLVVAAWLVGGTILFHGHHW